MEEFGLINPIPYKEEGLFVKNTGDSFDETYSWNLSHPQVMEPIVAFTSFSFWVDVGNIYRSQWVFLKAGILTLKR